MTPSRSLPVALSRLAMALATLSLGPTLACGETEAPETGSAAPRLFASKVVSYSPGEGSGFGQDLLPQIVLGPPRAGEVGSGSLDALALGVGGEIVLGFETVIVDRPGVDFVVFENAFRVNGSSAVYREPGEVSVSDDGVTFVPFPCDPKAAVTSGCAGMTPTLSSPENGVSALDPAAAGGDGFDLAAVGLARARFVRIRDLGLTSAAAAPSAGFDLDAISIVHGTTEPP